MPKSAEVFDAVTQDVGEDSEVHTEPSRLLEALRRWRHASAMHAAEILTTREEAGCRHCATRLGQFGGVSAGSFHVFPLPFPRPQPPLYRAARLRVAGTCAMRRLRADDPRPTKGLGEGGAVRVAYMHAHVHVGEYYSGRSKGTRWRRTWRPRGLNNVTLQRGPCISVQFRQSGHGGPAWARVSWVGIRFRGGVRRRRRRRRVIPGNLRRDGRIREGHIDTDGADGDAANSVRSTTKLSCGQHSLLTLMLLMRSSSSL